MPVTEAMTAFDPKQKYTTDRYYRGALRRSACESIDKLVVECNSLN